MAAPEEDLSPLLSSTAHTPDSPAFRPKRTIIIEPVIFLYAAFSLTMVPMSEQFVYMKMAEKYGVDPLVATKGNSSQLGPCGNTSGPNSTFQIIQTIQEDSSQWLLYLSVAVSVPSIFSIIFIGTYSDVGGRKIAILLPSIGGMLKAIVFLIVIYLNLDVEFLLIGYVLDGLSGSQMCLYMAGFAYIADVTTEKDRSFRITVLEATIGIAAATCQVGVGYWIRLTGFFQPFIFILVLAVLNMIYVIFFVPETIKRTPGTRVCGTDTYCKIFRLYFTDDGTGKRWKLAFLLAVVFSISFVMVSLPDVLSLFMLDAPLCFDSVLIGYFQAGFLLSCQVGSLVAVKVLGKCLSDIWICFIGCLFTMATTIFIAFAVTPTLMYIGKYFSYLPVKPLKQVNKC